jgi:hypothetical protein
MKKMTLSEFEYQYNIIKDLASRLFKAEDEVQDWLIKPNDYFFGKSPIIQTVMGNGRSVISFLKERAGITEDIDEN